MRRRVRRMKEDRDKLGEKIEGVMRRVGRGVGGGGGGGGTAGE